VRFREYGERRGNWERRSRFWFSRKEGKLIPSNRKSLNARIKGFDKERAGTHQPTKELEGSEGISAIGRRPRLKKNLGVKELDRRSSLYAK